MACSNILGTPAVKQVLTRLHKSDQEETQLFDKLHKNFIPSTLSKLKTKFQSKKMSSKQSLSHFLGTRRAKSKFKTSSLSIFIPLQPLILWTETKMVSSPKGS